MVELNEQYLTQRNEILRLKRMREELRPACDRDELIEKALVERQLAYFLIPFRQPVLAIPSKLRRQLANRFYSGDGSSG
jgi:hypothetical protein